MESSPTGRRLAAAFFSSVFPGLGQFYNRQPGKGVAFLVAGAIFMWLSVREAPAAVSLLLQPAPVISPSLIAWTCLLLAAYAWSMIDAWRCARPRS